MNRCIEGAEMKLFAATVISISFLAPSPRRLPGL